MVLPKAIAAELDARTEDEVPEAFGADCVGAKFHSPRPLVARAHQLPDGSTAHLCGTCWDNLVLLLEMQEDGPLPWPVLRAFGNTIRELGTRR